MLKKLHSLRVRYKGELLFVLSNYSTPVVGLVASIVAAAYIDPEDFGTIQAILLFAPYLSLLQLGAFNGLNRNLSFYKAQNRPDKVQDLVDASKTVANLVSLIGVVIASIIFAYNIQQGTLVILASITLIIILMLRPQITHFDTTFRSGQNFSVLGKIKFLENVVNTFVGLLPILIGYLGRIIYDVFKPILEWGLRYKNQPYRSVKRGRMIDIKELIEVGFPLLIGGYILQLFLVADQSVVAIFLGKEELGFYTLSKLILLAVPVIPQSLGVILYPKASAQYSLLKNNRHLRTFFWKSLLLNFIVLTPVCLMIFFLIEPTILWLMPKYEAGIIAAKINVLTCFTFISNGPSIIVAVVRRNLPLIVANFVALGLIWLMAWGLDLRSSLNLENIAWLRFWVALGLSLTTMIFSYYLTTVDEFNR